MNIEDFPELYTCDGHLPFTKHREKSNQIQMTYLSEEALIEIRSMLQTRGNPTKGALFKTRKNRRHSTRSINDSMKSLVEKAFPKRESKWKTKNLRDSYNNALMVAEIQERVHDLMMGHVQFSAKRHYPATEQTIAVLYEKAFKHLSINHGTREKVQLRKRRTNIQKRLISYTYFFYFSYFSIPSGKISL